MGCTNPNPVQTFVCPTTGAKSVMFKFKGEPDMLLPCKKCEGCKLDLAREWSLRLYHESLIHKENCFVTLTYDDEHLPKNGGLHHRDFQLFLKRLRKKFGNDISFFMCGEYGEQTHRAHYHAILFGYYPADAQIHRIQDKFRYYTSETLEKLWGKGNTLTTEFTQANARYCANYCQKKQLPNKPFQDRYIYTDENGDGQVRDFEYAKMSTRPAIGTRWAEKHTDWALNGYFIDDQGKKAGIPKLYREILKESDPDLYDQLLVKRRESVNEAEQTPDRLRQKAICISARAKNSTRLSSGL